MMADDVMDREETGEVPEAVDPVDTAGDDSIDEDVDETSDGSGDEAGSDAGDEEKESAPINEENYLQGLVEAVLFLSNEPLPVQFFVKNFSIDATQAKIIIDTLVDDYSERDGGVKLMKLSRGYQFVTNERYASQLRMALGMKKKEKLSRGMLETLAMIAYKQPIVLAEIDELRGASSRMMVANLMKKNLIKPVGRQDLPGRPLAYGTSDEFLRYFGLNKLSDLPKLSEIKEFSIDGDTQ
jgi:segregation and condensation protein B